MIVTKKDLKEAKTTKGGFTKDQVEFIIGLTGSRKWGKNIIGLNIPDTEWNKFKSLAAKSEVKKRPVLLNSTTVKKDWAWKPEKTDIPPPKFKELKSKKRKKRAKFQDKNKSNKFYSSREWLELRYRALRWHGFSCMCCGKTKDQGAQLHVDHIKPRSKHPELSLSFNNLQVLCRQCNMGKSNKYDDDFRGNKEVSKLDESKKLLKDLRDISKILDKDSSIKAYHIFKDVMESNCDEEAEDLDNSHLDSIRGVHF